jgi:hypothetical protein
MVIRSQGIAVEYTVERKEKDTREYLDDYYNTDKAVAARNLIRFTHFRHIRGCARVCACDVCMCARPVVTHRRQRCGTSRSLLLWPAPAQRELAGSCF